MLQLTKRSWQFSVVRRFATRLSGGFVVTVGLCIVLVQSAEALIGVSESNSNVLRGLVEIFALVSVTFNIPED